MLRAATPTFRNRCILAVLLAAGVSPFFFNYAWNVKLVEYPAAFWALDVLLWSVLPLIVFCIIRKTRLCSMQQLGLHLSIRGQSHRGWFLLAMFVVPAVCVAINRPLCELAWRLFAAESWPPAFDYGRMLPPRGPMTGLTRLLAVTYLSVSAGLIEEFYYRGLARAIFGGRWWADLLFIALSSLLFAAAHEGSGAVHHAYAFAWGVIFAAIYVALDNLWPVILGHAAVDFVVFAGS